jgi:hypothetical protein
MVAVALLDGVMESVNGVPGVLAVINNSPIVLPSETVTPSVE